MSIIDKVKNTIEKNCLIKKGESVLVALSGGSDSIAMLHILSVLSEELGFSLYCAHINHNIRDEAKDDEEFVKSYCKNLGIECFIKNEDVLSYAKENSISTELAGRKIRYDF
ncbi:MAG: tRNA(Ile)-lysidine synthetase, partial [Clostridia bacterium]|nr:tRNA(Ile)-lysidine synthetase [Clostridia bacterium]